MEVFIGGTSFKVSKRKYDDNTILTMMYETLNQEAFLIYTNFAVKIVWFDKVKYRYTTAESFLYIYGGKSLNCYNVFVKQHYLSQSPNKTYFLSMIK